MEIPLVSAPMEEVVSVAGRYDRWAYDAGYLAMAERERIQLITADRRPVISGGERNNLVFAL